MSVTQFLKLGVSVTDTTLPIFNPNDPLLVNGSKWLFDFARVACWPSQANPADNASINNLVAGAPSAVVRTANGISFTNGGFAFPGQTNNFLNLGSSYSFAGVTNPSFVVLLWMKTDSSLTNSYQPIIGRGSSTNIGNAQQVQYNIDSGVAGGKRPRATASSTGSSIPVAIVTQDIAQDTTVNQIALVVEGTAVRIYLNNVLSHTAPTALDGPLFENNLNTLIASGTWKGTVYRTYCEDCKTSGRTPANVISLDYAANNGRFVV